MTRRTREPARLVGAWGPYELHADAVQYVVSRQGRPLGYYRHLHGALERIAEDVVRREVQAVDGADLAAAARTAYDHAVAAVAAIAAQPADVTAMDLRVELSEAVLQMSDVLRGVLPLFPVDDPRGLQVAEAMRRVVVATMAFGRPLRGFCALDQQSSENTATDVVDVGHVSLTAAQCAGNGVEVR